MSHTNLSSPNKPITKPTQNQNPLYKNSVPDILSIMETAGIKVKMRKKKSQLFSYNTDTVYYNIMGERSRQIIVFISYDGIEIVEKPRRIPRDELDEFQFQMFNSLEGLCYERGVLIVQDTDQHMSYTYGLITNSEWWESVPAKELSILYDSLMHSEAKEYLLENPTFFQRYA